MYSAESFFKKNHSVFAPGPFFMLVLERANDKHKPPRRLRGKPLCQQARPKARFPAASTRQRRGRLDAMLGG